VVSIVSHAGKRAYDGLGDKLRLLAREAGLNVGLFLAGSRETLLHLPRS
jgi:hypothetical protein